MNKLNGITASIGKCKGTILFFDKGDNPELVSTDTILVTNELSKEYNPLIIKSKAVISTHGGVTSHIAIICRELKKPCIVNCRDVKEKLKNNTRIELDADNLGFSIIND